MEPGEALKRSFGTIEWRILKLPPDTAQDLKEPTDAAEASEMRLAKKRRSEDGVAFSQRHRVYPVLKTDTNWRHSLQDHLRLPLWPESMPLDGRILGFWIALCLRPELLRVELWNQNVRKLCILSWQHYVVVLDLLQGPLTAPGPLSFQIASLWELSQQRQTVAALSRALSVETNDWQILLYLRQTESHQPSVLLRWSELV